MPQTNPALPSLVHVRQRAMLGGAIQQPPGGISGIHGTQEAD